MLGRGLAQGDHDAVPADDEGVALGIERRRGFQAELELLGALLRALPDCRQHVLNRCARRRLGQHFTQAVFDFARNQAGTQKRRHPLQLRHHESTRHAAGRCCMARTEVDFLFALAVTPQSLLIPACQVPSSD